MTKEQKEILKFVRAFKRGTKLKSYMNCFKICAPLCSIMRLSGYDGILSGHDGILLVEGYLKGIRGLVKGNHNHFWLKYKDYIIDPTADQFNKPNGEPMPEFYIGPKPDWYVELYTH